METNLQSMWSWIYRNAVGISSLNFIGRCCFNDCFHYGFVVMGRRIDSPYSGLIELFLIPASAPWVVY